MSRPLPLHGRLEDVITTFARWRRRALADGRIDDHEARELSDKIVAPMLVDVRLLVKTQRFVATVMGGSEGVHSPAAMRTWDEIQAEIAWGIGTEDSDPEPPAAMANAA
jgi:hypothetical protein